MLVLVWPAVRSDLVLRRPLGDPLADSAAPCRDEPPDNGEMEHAETKHLERAPARGPVGPVPRTKPRCCAITRCPTTTSSRSGCGAGDTTGWVSHSSSVPSDIRGEFWQCGGSHSSERPSLPLPHSLAWASKTWMDMRYVRKHGREHLAELRRIYGNQMFSGRCARDLKLWLEQESEEAHSNEGLARRFVEECLRWQVILPGLSVLERLCADALVAAERQIEARLVPRLRASSRVWTMLCAWLSIASSPEEVDGGMSRFVWLRRFEVGRNSADINSLLDRLEFLQGFELPSELLDTVTAHRIARLRRQGERYFPEELRDISSDRRLAILGVCVVEWRGAVADAVVETHDRIVGQTFRSAKQRCDARLQDSKKVLQDTLHSFRLLGAALLEAKGDGAAT